MSRELLQQALDYIKETYDFCAVMQQPKEREEQLIKALEAELATPEQEAAIQHLWECLGRWSSYLVVNGTQANMAPPNWLLDAVIAATSPPRKEWVGLTDKEFKFIASKYLLNTSSGLGYFQEEIEANLKEKNTTNQ